MQNENIQRGTHPPVFDRFVKIFLLCLLFMRGFLSGLARVIEIFLKISGATI